MANLLEIRNTSFARLNIQVRSTYVAEWCVCLHWSSRMDCQSSPIFGCLKFYWGKKTFDPLSWVNTLFHLPVNLSAITYAPFKHLPTSHPIPWTGLLAHLLYQMSWVYLCATTRHAHWPNYAYDGNNEGMHHWNMYSANIVGLGDVLLWIPYEGCNFWRSPC